MKCFHPSCWKSAPMHTLFRINAKGGPAIWACRDHKQHTDKKPDPELDAIVTKLERRELGKPDALSTTGESK